MTRGRIHKARRGGYAGGQPPYGYRAERGSKVLVVHEEEARVVRRIFTLRGRGLSPYRIADILNREGRPTRRGGSWTARLVYNILGRRALYEGRSYRYAGVEAASQIPAILGL
jgi:DNA invertase Pin-like site-specific DNA recombinase